MNYKCEWVAVPPVNVHEHYLGGGGEGVNHVSVVPPLLAATDSGITDDDISDGMMS